MTKSSINVHRLPARESIIGEDTRIRRFLPHRERRMVGAWCFLDHAGPVQFASDKGMHVGAHPHIGLQTFTWMIQGEVIHRNSLGNEQVIRPGQVNLMTSGRGIVHTEDSVAEGQAMHAVQLWIALPDEERHREPAFENHPQLPVIHQDGFTATVLAGTHAGATSPATVYTPLIGIDWVAAAAATTRASLQPAFEHGVLVLEGAVQVSWTAAGEGERQTESVDAETLLYLPLGLESVEFHSDAACRLLLLGGKPFGEDILLWWNLVARRQDELEKALHDWEAGSGRFGQVRPGSLGSRLKAPELPALRHPASAASTRGAAA